MGADPITIGLIASTVASSVGVAQQVGSAQASVSQQKQANRFNDAKRNNEAAQAEKGRQETLRRALAAQRAGLAAAGIDATSQSALAQADALVSRTKSTAKQQNAATLAQSQGVNRGQLNQSVFRALGQAGDLLQVSGS